MPGARLFDQPPAPGAAPAVLGEAEVKAMLAEAIDFGVERCLEVVDPEGAAAGPVVDHVEAESAGVCEEGSELGLAARFGVVWRVSLGGLC